MASIRQTISLPLEQKVCVIFLMIERLAKRKEMGTQFTKRQKMSTHWTGYGYDHHHNKLSGPFWDKVVKKRKRVCVKASNWDCNIKIKNYRLERFRAWWQIYVYDFLISCFCFIQIGILLPKTIIVCVYIRERERDRYIDVDVYTLNTIIRSLDYHGLF